MKYAFDISAKKYDYSHENMVFVVVASSAGKATEAARVAVRKKGYPRAQIIELKRGSEVVAIR